MHPIAFKFGALTITWYGLLVAIGFVLGLWTAARRAPRDGLAPDKVMDLGPWLIIGTIIGARALYVISYWHEEYANRPLLDIFAVWRGGLVFYGGFIGACLGCILYARVRKVPLWKLADAAAPSIALGYAFGRIGCLMNGCCYGRKCDLPWAITFPPGSQTAPPGVPLHPTQIYDSLLNLCFYGFLAWMYRRKKFDGQIFAFYLIGYSLLRSSVELFRGDYAQHYLGGWATPAHLVSIAVFATGLILMVVLARRPPILKPRLEDKGLRPKLED